MKLFCLRICNMWQKCQIEKIQTQVRFTCWKCAKTIQNKKSGFCKKLYYASVSRPVKGTSTPSTPCEAEYDQSRTQRLLLEGTRDFPRLDACNKWRCGVDTWKSRRFDGKAGTQLFRFSDKFSKSNRHFAKNNVSTKRNSSIIKLLAHETLTGFYKKPTSHANHYWRMRRSPAFIKSRHLMLNARQIIIYNTR